MSGDACLSDEDLCALVGGEGPSETQAAHLAVCAACDKRLRRLRNELTSIRRLHGGPRHKAVMDVPRARPAFIGKYFVVGVLDENELFIAYRGLHAVLQVEVVIWRSPIPWDSSREALDLILPGYRRLAELRHPGIAAVLDVDVDEGCPCLVTQYVRGKRLDDVMREGPMPSRAAAELVAAVAKVLAEAHRQGIAHGSLRTRSIVVDEQGQPHIVDLGVAGLSRLAGRSESAAVAGEAEATDSGQSAPAESERAARQDTYDLVAILEKLLAGTARDAVSGSDSSLCAGRPALSSVPRGLRAICRRGLDPDPARRFADAGELAAVLRQFLTRSKRRTILVAAFSAAILAAWILWWFLP